MEPLLKQLGELPRRFAAFSRGVKIALVTTVLLCLGLVAAATVYSSSNEYQYAFSNLSADDSAEISAQLKAQGVPFRFEAGGAALAVPAARVYDVRLLLATAGLPRSSGSGMELFDKGDFGQSEFTQKVNLQRATEGELARTISRFSGVKSARVHLVMPEKGVFRGQERASSAAVALTLQPGRVLNERELAGLKHLVSSAVPALSPDSVTIVDQRGAVISGGAGAGEGDDFQKKLQRDLEQKVVSLLEPVVGTGQVVVRATVDVETAEVITKQHAIDTDNVAPLTERTVTSNQQQQSTPGGGVAGAAANQPMNPQGTTGGNQQKSNNTSQEENKTWDLSHVDTQSVQKQPRVSRISMAILLDGVDGKPRADAEVQRLGELARSAVGISAARGDSLDISSAVFTHSADEAPVPAPAAALAPWWVWAAIGGGVLLLAAIGLLMLRRRGGQADRALLRPGASVAELEAGTRAGGLTVEAALKDAPVPLPLEPKALPDPSIEFREQARVLAKADPVRAAHLLRAWINPEGQQREPRNG